MKTLRKATLTLSIALAVASVALPTSAGTVAGFGGSTEITQLANNVQLGMSYVEQVETALNSARQYKLMIDQVRRNPGDFAKGMLGGTLEEHLARADDTVALIDSLEGLSTRTRDITGEWMRAKDVLESLNSQGVAFPPDAYYDAMVQIAEERGGEHAQRVEAYKDNLLGAQQDVDRVNAIVAQSNGMTTQIQGLQNVVASNAVIASLLARQIQLTTTEQALDEQDRLDRARNEALQIEAARRNAARVREAMERDFGITDARAE